MHLCLTVECITSGLHLSVFLIRSPPPPPQETCCGHLCVVMAFIKREALRCNFICIHMLLAQWVVALPFWCRPVLLYLVSKA